MHMYNRYKKLIPLIIAGFMIYIPTVGLAQTALTDVTWTGAASNEWTTPGNWDSGAVPDATNKAIIPTGSTVNITAAVSSIGGIDVATGSTLNIGNSISILSEIEIGGTVDVTTNGMLHFLNSAGTSEIISGATISLSGGILTVGSNGGNTTFRNGSTLSINNTSTTRVDLMGATLEFESGATINLQTPIMTFPHFKIYNANSTLTANGQNFGNILKLDDEDTTTTESVLASLTGTLTANTLTINDGELQIAANLTVSSTISVEGTATTESTQIIMLRYMQRSTTIVPTFTTSGNIRYEVIFENTANVIPTEASFTATLLPSSQPSMINMLPGSRMNTSGSLSLDGRVSMFVNGATLAVSANITGTNNATLTAGRFGTITIGRDFDMGTNNAFQLDASAPESTVQFEELSTTISPNTRSTITGNYTFYNLSILDRRDTNTRGKEVVFAHRGANRSVGVIITVQNRFLVQGQSMEYPAILQRSGPTPTLPFDNIYHPVIHWQLVISENTQVSTIHAQIETNYATRPILNQDIIRAPVDWTYNWLTTQPLSSITQDINSNGKIDRIQISYMDPLNDMTINYSNLSRSNFLIEVQGYTIREYNSCGSPGDTDICIELDESDMFDSGNTPSWRIVTNNVIGYSSTVLEGGIFTPITVPLQIAQDNIPIDRVPPRIGYSLGVAGRNEIFIRFSETVYRRDNDALQTGNFQNFVSTGAANGAAPTSLNILFPGGGSTGGVQEILLEMNAPLDIDDVLSGTFTISDFKDSTTTPTNVTSSHTVPISDIVAYHPTITPSMRDIAPIFINNNSADGTMLITFDGTQKIRSGNDIFIQTRDRQNRMPQMIIGFDIPPESRSSGGLWLPNPLPDLVNRGYENGISLSPQRLNANTINHHISAETVINRVQDLHFIYFLPSVNKHLVALHSTANDWYRNLTTFSFQISEFTSQRNQISVVNNVINLNNGERATLLYSLLKDQDVSITVFDIAGNVINRLVRSRQISGFYEVTWNGDNTAGNSVARGLYYIRVRIGDSRDAYRTVLVVRH